MQDDLSSGERVPFITNRLVRLLIYDLFLLCLLLIAATVWILVASLRSDSVNALFAPLPLVAVVLFGRAGLGLYGLSRRGAVQFTPDQLRYWDTRGTLHEIAWTAIDHLTDRFCARLHLHYCDHGEAKRLDLPYVGQWDRGSYPRRGRYFAELYTVEGGLPSRIVSEIRTRAGLTERRTVWWAPYRATYCRPSAIDTTPKERT